MSCLVCRRRNRAEALPAARMPSRAAAPVSCGIAMAAPTPSRQRGVQLVGILIVDDSDATNRSLRSFLESRGYSGVRTVTSGGEALDLLGAGNGAAGEDEIEVVLLDLG